jgi:sn-glycerol 3-phosphate transport system ATP-binding protein
MNLLRQAPGTRVGEVLGVRPEHLEVSDTGWQLEVETAELLGAERLVYGRVNGEPLVVRMDPSRPVPAAGGTLAVTPRPGSLHRFDAQTGKRLPD